MNDLTDIFLSPFAVNCYVALLFFCLGALYAMWDAKRIVGNIVEEAKQEIYLSKRAREQLKQDVTPKPMRPITVSEINPGPQEAHWADDPHNPNHKPEE